MRRTALASTEARSGLSSAGRIIGRGQVRSGQVAGTRAPARGLGGRPGRPGPLSPSRGGEGPGPGARPAHCRRARSLANPGGRPPSGSAIPIAPWYLFAHPAWGPEQPACWQPGPGYYAISGPASPPTGPLTCPLSGASDLCTELLKSAQHVHVCSSHGPSSRWHVKAITAVRVQKKIEALERPHIWRMSWIRASPTDSPWYHSPA
jgi:hypothetical protein